MGSIVPPPLVRFMTALGVACPRDRLVTGDPAPHRILDPEDEPIFAAVLVAYGLVYDAEERGARETRMLETGLAAMPPERAASARRRGIELAGRAPPWGVRGVVLTSTATFAPDIIPDDATRRR